MEIFPGISVDPGIRFGKPCIAGTRMDVATVIGALGAGESYESVEESYSLTREQILAALHRPRCRPPAAGGQGGVKFLLDRTGGTRQVVATNT